MSSWWVSVNGYPLTEIAAHGSPQWETVADGGCGEMSVDLYTPRGYEHPALKRQAIVKVYLGLLPVYTGFLVDFSAEGQLVARGLSARQYYAFDSLGNVTRDVGAAIVQAQNRGWQITNPELVAGVSAGDTSQPITVASLLDEWAQETGSRWGVDGRARLYVRPDPPAPMWHIAANVVTLGTTSEGGATRLVGRYLEGGIYKTVARGVFGGDEEPVDLTGRGEITTAQATAILDTALAATATRPGWLGGTTISRSQITNGSGRPAPLGQVLAGQKVRIHGAASVTAGSLWIDETIGKTRYVAGENSIYLEPVNAAPRTLTDVIAAA